MTKFLAIDFFCGVGGLTLGLKNAGIDVILGIDNDPTVSETYVKNNATEFWQADINSLKHTVLERFLSKYLDSDTVLIFAGCAPCQPFSKINRSGSKSSDVSLLIQFGKLIAKFRPDFVISENVPQIVRHKKVFQQFVRSLQKEGYHVSYSRVNAKDFQVPQHRQRLVLLAARDSQIDLPKPRRRSMTVRQAIGHYPKLQAGETHSKLPNHQAMKLSALNYKRIDSTPHNGGDSRDWPNRLNTQCHKKTIGYYDVYGRMSWDRPAPTLTTRCVSYSNGRYGHPVQNRAISLREAAAIQSFPDYFVFYTPISVAARHVGNAVPPRMAMHLGKQVIKTFQKSQKIQTKK